VDATCPVCAKHRGQGPLAGELLGEDDLVLVWLRADGPAGYAFVETRRHVGGLEHLTPEEAAAVGRWTSRVAAALTWELPVERVHTFVAGLGVDHFHQHVYVRPSGTPVDAPWWPPPSAAVPVDRRAFAARLRPHLALATDG